MPLSKIKTGSIQNETILDEDIAPGTISAAKVVGGSLGGDYNMQVFESPGTWTKPAGLKAVKVTVVGGGGGGYSPAGDGESGGTSSFGAFASATGGGGGIGGAIGKGGIGSSGDLNIQGQPGQITTAGSLYSGAPSILGGGALAPNNPQSNAAGFGAGGGSDSSPGASGGASIRRIPASSISGPVAVTTGAAGEAFPAFGPVAPRRTAGGPGVVIIEEFY
jgi:hypothetical protein